MKARRKKKGSTFVIVILVMAIIFTMGTTILAVTANDYKMRINQSKKLQNFYEVDSGLDVVENIIIKTSQEAIKYADKEVKKEFSKLADKDRNEDVLNKNFKDNFYKFLSDTQTVREVNGTEKTVEKILEYLILSKEVIGSIEDNKTINLKKLQDIKDFNIEILKSTYDKGNNNITIEVKSTFQSSEGQLKNEKVISTQFKVSAPDYNSEITSINIYPVFDGKAITADGNMDVTGGDVSVNGDIWIKGQDTKKDTEYTFNKYIDGIRLNSTKFKIEGNIYTDNTFKVVNNVSGEQSNGNIYARNIYIGKENYGDLSSNNKFIFNKDVIANNDLAMNTSNSDISIKGNFYGINDKNIETETAPKALSSSSIIINNPNSTSKLTVEKDSYIMGVAYLNTIGDDGKKYQTGESVAVKGNYLAYTDVDNILYGENNVTLKYYSPLQLLESKDNKSNATIKGEYFAEYYNAVNKEGKYLFNDGGVELKGEVKSAGASVKDKDGKIRKPNVSSEDLNIVDEKRKEFERNVFAMGDATNYENSDQVVKRTVKDQINFDKLLGIENSSINISAGVVILNGKKDDKIEIKNNKYNGQTIDKGLIITNGDITIDSDVEFNFTGNIITTGNIILKGTGNKNINYDPQVVRNVLALNQDLLKDIFVGEKGNRQEVRVTSTSELYSVDKFLSKSLWKIVK